MIVGDPDGRVVSDREFHQIHRAVECVAIISLHPVGALERGGQSGKGGVDVNVSILAVAGVDFDVHNRGIRRGVVEVLMNFPSSMVPAGFVVVVIVAPIIRTGCDDSFTAGTVGSAPA